jgi:hypothetical protein
LGQPPFTRRFKDCGELFAPIFASSWLVNPANLPLARTMLARLNGHRWVMHPHSEAMIQPQVMGWCWPPSTSEPELL